MRFLKWMTVEFQTLHPKFTWLLTRYKEHVLESLHKFRIFMHLMKCRMQIELLITFFVFSSFLFQILWMIGRFDTSIKIMGGQSSEKCVKGDTFLLSPNFEIWQTFLTNDALNGSSIWNLSVMYTVDKIFLNCERSMTQVTRGELLKILWIFQNRRCVFFGTAVLNAGGERLLKVS